MRTSVFYCRIAYCGLRALLAAATLLSVLSFAPLLYAQSAPRVALITRSVPVPGADVAYVEHLLERGWDVTLIDDDEIRVSGQGVISGYDLVVISSTVYPARIGSRLRDAPEPIIVAEHSLYPKFHMTGTKSGDWGFTTSARMLEIVNPVTPMAAGFNGDVSVSTKAKQMNFGKVGSDAYIIATAKDAANQAVIFAYDAGGRLFNGGIARGTRVGFYMSQKHPKHANRDGWALFDAAAAWATPMAPEPEQGGTPTPNKSIAQENSTLLGANVSKENFSSRYDAVLGFERQIGRDLDIVNRFHEFSSGKSSSFYWDRQHIEDGRTVMISWRATDNPGSTKGQPDPKRAQKIVNGRFDAEIEAMATALRDLNAPVLLRFNWEMDQNYGDPQYIGTAEEFIAAWRYVHAIFEQRGATNVAWVWAPRARSFAKGVGQTFFPGHEYVDWVGGSAVPINSFTDAQTIYSDWNDWAASIGKPQLLWIGLRENPNDARWKAKFVNELQALASGQWSGLKALVYYSSNSPRRHDYTIDTSSNSLRAFRELACDPQFTGVHGC